MWLSGSSENLVVSSVSRLHFISELTRFQLNIITLFERNYVYVSPVSELKYRPFTGLC